MITRRNFLAVGSAAALTACSQPAPDTVSRQPVPVEPIPPLPPIYGAVTDEPYPVPAVPEGVVPQRLWRQTVDNPLPQEAPGTIIVDPDEGYLYLVQADGKALRYGAGTGAAAFSWSGVARLQYSRKWPRWKVPESMAERRPELAAYTVENGGMDPGPGNPLGARALYLFQNGEDTLYRIHGGCEPEHLGKAVSSGCVRLLDQDAIDLFDRAEQGAKVWVLPSLKPPQLGALY
ncbi:L,D-transpeptidase [Tropicimonas marinistellae]|uniref:L,D-transpeptidase n=1 Tax=Tropicimonas marinistellae TaxID=1739787 RepID=UPI00082AC72E|nr:L,D-transpeptidase [Tropicimonas marinistellae]